MAESHVCVCCWVLRPKQNSECLRCTLSSAVACEMLRAWCMLPSVFFVVSLNVYSSILLRTAVLCFESFSWLRASTCLCVECSHCHSSIWYVYGSGDWDIVWTVGCPSYWDGLNSPHRNATYVLNFRVTCQWDVESLLCWELTSLYFICSWWDVSVNFLDSFSCLPIAQGLTLSISFCFVCIV